MHQPTHTYPLNRYAIRRNPADDDAKRDVPIQPPTISAELEVPSPKPHAVGKESPLSSPEAQELAKREVPKRESSAADSASASKPRRKILTVKKNT